MRRIKPRKNIDIYLVFLISLISIPFLITIGANPGSTQQTNNKIAFSSDINGNFDIFVFHLKGKTIEQITTHKSLDDSPAWSPDGKKIAFISTRTGTMAIWIKELQTGKIIKLTPSLDDTIACKDIAWH